MADLKYNPQEKSMQGSLKIFINDFESELSKVENKKIDLLHPKDTSVLRQQIDKYIHNHFKINVNTLNLRYTILGFEKEDEAFWIYLETDVCPIPKNIKLENSLLFETIKDQTNIVQIEVNAIKKSFKQNKPQKLFNFDF